MSQFVDFLNRAAEVWWPFVFHGAWQAAVIGAVVLVVLRFGKRWPSPVRYGLVLLALIKFLVPPMAAFPSGILSQFELPANKAVANTGEADGSLAVFSPSTVDAPEDKQLAGRSESRSGSSDVSMRELVEKASAASTTSTEANAAPTAPMEIATSKSVASDANDSARETPTHSSTNLSVADPPAKLHAVTWLMLLQIVGAIVFAMAAWYRLRSIRQIVAGSASSFVGSAGPQFESIQRLVNETSAALALRRTPKIVVTPDFRVPFSAGILQPVVVLPQHAVDTLTDDEMRTVLLHELVHHQRGDLWMTWLQFVVSVLWWFHPVVWLVNRSIRNTREDCCDDLLLSRSYVPAADYCQTILKVAKGLRESRRPALLPIASMADRHPLAERITRIMDGHIPRKQKLGLVGIGVVLIAACLLLPGLSRAPKSNVREDGTVAVDEAPVAETGETVSISGRLVDSNGKPVAQAKVWLAVEEKWESTDEGPPVIGEAQSNEDGRFEMKPLKSQVDRFVRSDTTKSWFWVIKPGFALTQFAHEGGIPEQSVEISLAPAPSTAFQIRNPDGSNCEGAELTVQTIRNAEHAYLTIPEVVRQSCAVRTNAEGQADVAIDHATIVVMGISKPELGSQHHLHYRENVKMPTKLKLRNAGAVEGRLVLPRGGTADLSKVKVRVATLDPPDPNDEPYWAGTATIHPDRDGRFEIPHLAEGMIRVFVTEPDNFAYRSVPPDGLLVSAGEVTKLEIPMQQTVKVSRVIQDAKTKAPIPGVRVNMQDKFQHVYARTNAEGRFTVFLRPETRYHTVYDMPRGYMYRYISNFDGTSAPDGVDSIQLDPVELMPGRTLDGFVVNADGQPFADVQVGVQWRDPNEDFGIMGVNSIDARQWGTTDAQGRFTIDEVNPDVDVTLFAALAGTRLSDDKSVPLGSTEPIKLETKKFDFVSLDGRLIDESQKPVPGVKISVLVADDISAKDEGWRYGSQATTDAEGRFKTPAHYPRQSHFRVSVRFGPKELATSTWIHPATDGTTFADVTVKRSDVLPGEATEQVSKPPVPDLEGSIVDSSDKPVADAQIIAWHNAKRVTRRSANDGHFVLSSIPAKDAWLFVKADGFRFHGMYIADGTSSPKIQLVRTDEPVSTPWQTLRATQLNTATDELARDGFRKFVESYYRYNDASVTKYDRENALVTLASVDPESALKLIGDKGFASAKIDVSGADIVVDQRQKMRVRVACAKQFAPNNLAKAVQVIQPLDGFEKAHALMEVAEECAPALRVGLLNEAAPFAEQISQETFRTEFLARLAAMFRDNAEEARARALFQTALAGVPQPGDDERIEYTRGYLAWQLVPTDPDAALKLLPADSSKPGQEYYRILANVAHQLAAVRPEESERLLDIVRKASARDVRLDTVVRVCYRMATADLPRAERLAREKAPNRLLSAYALGLIALAAEDQSADHRLKLLDEAYGLLEADIDSRHGTIYHPLTIAVGLLPVVEQVAPDRLQEYFWRALSLRTGISIGMESRALGNNGPENAMRIADPVLGACLARYNTRTANLLTLSPGDQTLDMGYSDAPFFLVGSLAISNPEAAVGAVSQLPTATERDFRNKHEAWKFVFAMLGKSPTQRWEYLMSRQYMLWRPDTVDH